MRTDPLAEGVPLQRLLWTAAFGAPQAAARAWQEWNAQANLDTAGGPTFDLLPRIYRNLSGLPGPAPEMARLKGVYRRALAANAAYFQRYLPVFQLFAAHASRPILLEEAGVAAAVPNGLGVLPCQQITLLIPPETLYQLWRALTSTGWLAERTLYPTNITHITTYHQRLAFTHPDGRSLSLAWRLRPHSPPDELLAEAGTAAFAGEFLDCLAPHHQLLAIAWPQPGRSRARRVQAALTVICERSPDWQAFAAAARSQQMQAAALDLLTDCAYLAPEAIPLKIVSGLAPIARWQQLELRHANSGRIRPIVFAGLRDRPTGTSGASRWLHLPAYLFARWRKPWSFRTPDGARSTPSEVLREVRRSLSAGVRMLYRASFGRLTGWVGRRLQRLYTNFSMHPNFWIYLPTYAFVTHILRRPPVTVYQIGRVGSSSITEAARQHRAGLVFHTHSLVPDFIAAKAADLNFKDNQLRQYAGQNDAVARCVRWTLARGRMDFIVLVREPVAQSISQFFYTFTTMTGNSLERQDWSMAALRELYWQQNYPHSGQPRFEHWFKTELEHYTGFDVFAHPFDQGRGWQIYQHQHSRILVMRLELDAAVRDAVLGDFLRVQNFHADAKNTAKDKVYGDLYPRFRRYFSLSADEADAIYSGQFARHFYTPAEIEAFRTRWLQGRAAAPAGARLGELSGDGP